MEKTGKRSVVSDSYAKSLPISVRSLCPNCKRPLNATVFDNGGQVWISRVCPDHGSFEELYSEDTSYYHFCRSFAHESRGIDSPNVGKNIPNNGTSCPFDCGLCSNHHNHTALANVVVTNRCDLSCWYCFFYAKEGNPIYEPSLQTLSNIFENLRSQKPVGVNAVQLTGGEPTLRNDLEQIIRLAVNAGFEHIQLNTDGINLSRDPLLAERLKKAGTTIVYLSFDGVSSKTNPKNHFEIPLCLNHLARAKLQTVLVPTVIRGVNDSDAGSILNFGLHHLHVVRGINYQPVSLVGRMPKHLRQKQRITIPGLISALSEQTNGLITKDDFFPIPCVSPVSAFAEAFSHTPGYDLSTHFACGAAAYIFMDGSKPLPITHFVDIPGLLEYLDEKTAEIQSGSNKHLVLAKLLFRIGSFVESKKQPAGLDIARILRDLLFLRDYRALAQFHEKSLFVGMMHFMDLYNYDQSRVERCSIHYGLPDGRIVPFCAFNVIPEIYRDKIQAQHGQSWEEYHHNNPTVNLQYKYIRKPDELKNHPLYEKTYFVSDYFQAHSKEETK